MLSAWEPWGSSAIPSRATADGFCSSASSSPKQAFLMSWSDRFCPFENKTSQLLNGAKTELFGESGKDTRWLKHGYLKRPAFP